MSEQLTLFVEDSPARISVLPESGRDWLESGAGFGLSFAAFLQSLVHDGSLLRMSPACYPATVAGISSSSFEGWSNSGMASRGGFLTLSTTEYHSGAVVCSLSDILETDVPPKYSLSPKACAGILRRAEKRGKTLPDALARVLRQVADSEPTST